MWQHHLRFKIELNFRNFFRHTNFFPVFSLCLLPDCPVRTTDVMATSPSSTRSRFLLLDTSTFPSSSSSSSSIRSSVKNSNKKIPFLDNKLEKRIAHLFRGRAKNQPPYQLYLSNLYNHVSVAPFFVFFLLSGMLFGSPLFLSLLQIHWWTVKKKGIYLIKLLC